jgi:hypothetical protein
MLNAVAARVATRMAVVVRNVPLSSDFIFPRSPLDDKHADSFITVMASANIGSDRNVANEVIGRTAPMSSGET